MREVFSFIFKCMGQWIANLFTIDMGFMNLGALMSMLFIVFPAIITLLCIVKASVIDVEVKEPIKNSLRERRNKRNKKDSYYASKQAFFREKGRRR